MKISLPNGCSCSELSVYPSNWKSGGASMQKPWYIKYRFYDPKFKSPKQKVIKSGINEHKRLAERREATRAILENELMLLKSGYNPFYETFIPEQTNEVVPETPFANAIDFAFNNYKCSERTRSDMKYCMNFINRSAANAKLNTHPVHLFGKKQVQQLFAQLEIDKPSWNPGMRNKYRSYLISLFNVLEDYEAVTYNPVLKIKKATTVRKVRKVLSSEDRAKLNEYLNDWPDYKRFVNIFYHSGARISELMRLKVKHVNLKEQTYNVFVLKGKSPAEKVKVIKDIALPLWTELVDNQPSEYFLFSKGLRPGPEAIRIDQVSKRWYLHVKKHLGIEADLYSLKHLHTTEVAEILGETEAANHNSHANTAMVISIYDINNDKRKKAKVKTLANPL